MDRIEATEKAKALLGKDYAGMSEQHYYDCCGNDSDFYIYVQHANVDRRCASGHSWEEAIEDLEQSLVVSL